MQLCKTFSFTDLKIDRYNWVNSNYHNYLHIWLNHRTRGIMMEGNKDIFLACDDTLGYLAGSMHEKYSMTFIWGHSFSTCGSYDQCFDPSRIPPCVQMYAFRVPLPLRSDLIDLISPSAVLTLLVCHSFLISFYLRNSEIYD